MLTIVAWTLAHCNVCIDPQKPKFTEKPAILNLFFIIKWINKINILRSHLYFKYKSKSRGREEKINVFFSCGEVWLAGIGFLASAIETCEQEHSKISFCRQSKPS